MTKLSGFFVRALLEAAETHGVSREILLREGDVKLEDLQGLEARVDLGVFRRMILRALDLSGDPALGLHIGERASDTAFDMIGQLIAHASTLRHAIALCAQFQALFMDDMSTRLEERAGTARWSCEFPHTDPRFDALWSEFIAVGLVRALRAFAGMGAKPETVCFTHRRPAHYPEYTRLFGGAERFETEFMGIEFSAAMLDRAYLHRNPELHALLLPRAERALGQLGGPTRYSDRLRHYFLARSPARIPDMSDAARELGLSERSLRRKLAEEGISYRELVQTAQQTAACTMLRDPRSTIQEVARALDFADVTAFHRAFKRWVGVTPQEYREGAGRTPVPRTHE